MSDIKGLHRNYSDDAAEADEMMKPEHQLTPKMKSKNPPRPPRKGSLPRNASQYDMDHQGIIKFQIITIYLHYILDLNLYNL